MASAQAKSKLALAATQFIQPEPTGTFVNTFRRLHEPFSRHAEWPDFASCWLILRLLLPLQLLLLMLLLHLLLPLQLMLLLLIALLMLHGGVAALARAFLHQHTARKHTRTRTRINACTLKTAHTD
jgi:hypothetical protein